MAAPGSHAPPPVVQARGVGVTLQGQEILHGVDLEVPAGGFVGILGPNGGGKTTLLRTLLGLQAPTAGTVRLFGQDPRSPGVRHRLAYVPQHAVNVEARFPATAYEVALTARTGKRGLLARLRPDDHAIVREAMEEVGVWELRARPIGRLSGGQRQRVFLAKALAQQPDLLLLDEPTTGVDPEARADFHGLLRHLHQGHRMTILLVSHDPSQLGLLAERFVVVDRAKRFDGPPKEFARLGGHEHLHGVGLEGHRRPEGAA
ncbi:MAG TPA: metal ABC transporter ATP-binding protein [Candidatus Thermoplasmatota archaeon]|nr:metal ABC transporter ATP-binding protein [Candidatus Thermoplasmatota archaeon]